MHHLILLLCLWSCVAHLDTDLIRLDQLRTLERQWVVQRDLLRSHFWTQELGNGFASPIEECKTGVRAAMARATEIREIEKRLDMHLTPWLEECEQKLRCSYNTQEIEMHRVFVRDFCKANPDGWGCDCPAWWWDNPKM